MTVTDELKEMLVAAGGESDRSVWIQLTQERKASIRCAVAILEAVKECDDGKLRERLSAALGVCALEGAKL